MDNCSLLDCSSEVEDVAVTGNGRWREHSCSTKGAATPSAVTEEEKRLGVPVSNLRQQKKTRLGSELSAAVHSAYWIYEVYDAISLCLLAEQIGTNK